MHSCLDKNRRRTLAEFETKLLKDLNEAALVSNKTLDEKGEWVEGIMEGIKHVEIRKMEILSERKTDKK
jgi:hypothetical protein